MRSFAQNLCEQNNSIFFTIPREMRDEIYHNLFLTDCYPYHALPPRYLRTGPPAREPPRTSPASYMKDYSDYQLRYSILKPTTTSQLHGFKGNKNDNHTWLLTCKTVLREGLTQYFRNAEWVWCGVYAKPTIVRKGYWLPQLNTKTITRFELQVSNLANYETPCKREGVDSRSELATMADRMRVAQLKMEKIRFVGYSYALQPCPEGPHCGHQVENMMVNLMNVFADIQVSKWELGVYHDRPRGLKVLYWVLFEWVMETHKDQRVGELKLLVDRRYPVTMAQIGTEWIRQELRTRAIEEALEESRRKIVGRDWIRQELLRIETEKRTMVPLSGTKD